MADVKKCDRCERIYEEETSGALGKAISALSDMAEALGPLFGLGALEKRRRLAERTIAEFVDLCPECAKGFRKWMRGREENNCCAAGSDEFEQEAEG